jgi:hypothetical protein
MEGFLAFVSFLTLHGYEILGAITALLSALIGIALLIPGDQPEKTLQMILDFLSKFSKKPKE